MLSFGYDERCQLPSLCTRSNCVYTLLYYSNDVHMFHIFSCMDHSCIRKKILYGICVECIYINLFFSRPYPLFFLFIYVNPHRLLVLRGLHEKEESCSNISNSVLETVSRWIFHIINEITIMMDQLFFCSISYNMTFLFIKRLMTRLENQISLSIFPSRFQLFLFCSMIFSWVVI